MNTSVFNIKGREGARRKHLHGLQQVDLLQHEALDGARRGDDDGALAPRHLELRREGLDGFHGVGGGGAAVELQQDGAFEYSSTRPNISESHSETPEQ